LSLLAAKLVYRNYCGRTADDARRTEITMANHTCIRCGLETPCSRRSWADRHPAAAVTAGLVTLVFMGMMTLVFMGMMLSVHPVAAGVMLGLAGVGFGVRALERAQERRDALAARANYENRELMAASLKWPSVQRVAAQRPRCRGADHWSATEPLQS
jgi:hypothetical protein